jgi:leucyl-tRNA synthetase
MGKTDNKLYCLVMFLYPSGDRLHIGHWYNYGPTDSWARFKRMQGYNVLEPMGYDAFGLPAENYAIKQGIHPKTSTENNIEYIRKQLKAFGAMYDWSKEINTSSPEYYKWTQWMFLQLYKHDLAYRKKAAVNWCPSCQTVLANEQVIEGACERCESQVEAKDLEQWFFKITHYAQELLEGHDRIDWPEKTLSMQKNWIGKSVGATIRFEIQDHEETIEVFTTRPDTIFGVTYMVLAPEHPLVERVTTPEHKEAVNAYVAQTRRTKEIDRLSTEREKSGVFTGAYCVNPLNGERVPVWIADYVLVTYGTGAVMAVPAHDQRDFEFATQYRLPIREVISNDGKPSDTALTEAYEEPGIMINSGPFNGLGSSPEGIEAVIKMLKEKGWGDKKVNYRLRDWLISRQRYWGAPIPIVYCEKCGEVPIPEDQLPVLLPDEVEFRGKGESPLSTNPDFVNTPCPQCGGKGRREVDTMDTFVCSSWYFLRYPNPDLDDRPFDKELIDRWLPVDQYVGGAEHAVMHLLYARFFTKALHDFGYINFDEPFKRLVHQGTITNAGAKMSKSRGNVVNPDDYVTEYGSDTFRLYMMFMGSYEEGGDWSDEGIVGIFRFLKRVWRLVYQIKQAAPAGSESERFQVVQRQMHYAIKHVTIDLERFHFNTCVSRIMELVNEMYLYVQDVPQKEWNEKLWSETCITLVKLLAPFTPHMAEELWEEIGQPYSVFNDTWPEHEESMLIADTIQMGVQINGKIRSQIDAPADADQNSIFELALADDKVQKYTDGKQIVKKLIVPKKLVIFVVKG